MSPGLVQLEQQLRRARREGERWRAELPTARDRIKEQLCAYLAQWFNEAAKACVQEQAALGNTLSDPELSSLRESVRQLAGHAPEWVQREFGNEEVWDTVPRPSARGYTVLTGSYSVFYKQLRNIATALESVLQAAGLTGRVDTPRLPDTITGMVREYGATLSHIASHDAQAKKLEQEIAQLRAGDRWDRL